MLRSERARLLVRLCCWDRRPEEVVKSRVRVKFEMAWRAG
jgi:hypothetical protein